MVKMYELMAALSVELYTIQMWHWLQRRHFCICIFFLYIKIAINMVSVEDGDPLHVAVHGFMGMWQIPFKDRPSDTTCFHRRSGSAVSLIILTPGIHTFELYTLSVRTKSNRIFMIDFAAPCFVFGRQIMGAISFLLYLPSLRKLKKKRKKQREIAGWWGTRTCEMFFKEPVEPISEIGLWSKYVSRYGPGRTLGSQSRDMS